MTIPPELAERIRAADKQLDEFEIRLQGLEGLVRQMIIVEPAVRQLRLEFASIRSVVRFLMREIEEAAPMVAVTPQPKDPPE